MMMMQCDVNCSDLLLTSIILLQLLSCFVSFKLYSEEGPVGPKLVNRF